MSPVLSGGTSYYISPVTWLPWAHQHLSGPGSLTGSPSAGRGAPRGGQGGHGSCRPLVPGTGSAGALPTQPRACPAPGGLTSASRVQTQAHWPWPCCPGSRRGAVQENMGGSACRTHGKGLGPSPAWKVGSSRGRLPRLTWGSAAPVQGPGGLALTCFSGFLLTSPRLTWLSLSPWLPGQPGALLLCLSAFDSALPAPSALCFPFPPLRACPHCVGPNTKARLFCGLGRGSPVGTGRQGRGPRAWRYSESSHRPLPQPGGDSLGRQAWSHPSETGFVTCGEFA